MYPSFVIQQESNQYTGSRTLDICGQRYIAQSNDTYIDDAISLAGCWHAHQITFTSILHLRNWIRENDQHTHNIPYKHIKDLSGCKYFIDSIIEAEFTSIGPHYQENFYASLERTKESFTNRFT